MLIKPRDAERFLAAPLPPTLRAAIVHGRDLGKIHERADVIAAKAAPNADEAFDLARLTDSDLDADPARLESELAAVSMLGGKRLVRLRLSTDKPAILRLTEEGLSAHLEGRLNPEAMLLIEAGDLRSGSALLKIAERSDACVAIVCYEDETGDLARLAREALAAEKLSLSRDALEVFAARLPKERGVARAEIERLILYLGPGSGRTASAEELEDFLGVEPEASLSQAAIDAFGAKAAAAQANLRRAVQEGEHGVAAVRALSTHAATLRRVAVLKGAGKNTEAIAGQLRIFWKIKDEVFRQSRSWALPDLERLAADLLAADAACKRTAAPDHLIAERLTLNIAGRAKRLGL